MLQLEQLFSVVGVSDMVTVLAGSYSVSGATNGVGTSATFGSLLQLAISTNNIIYVADSGNIRKVTTSGEEVVLFECDEYLG